MGGYLGVSQKNGPRKSDKIDGFLEAQGSFYRHSHVFDEY